MVRILFVCLGNICRSPMAEAVFEHKVRAAGLEDKIEVDSAGTGDWHVGETANPGTLKVLRREGIRYDGRARQISNRDLERFDYIITMDAHNLRNVAAMGPTKATLAPLMGYAPEAGVTEVPDPYYDGRFELVFKLVNQAADGLLAAIRREHGL